MLGCRLGVLNGLGSWVARPPSGMAECVNGRFPQGALMVVHAMNTTGGSEDSAVRPHHARPPLGKAEFVTNPPASEAVRPNP